MAESTLLREELLISVEAKAFELEPIPTVPRQLVQRVSVAAPSAQTLRSGSNFILE